MAEMPSSSATSWRHRHPKMPMLVKPVGTIALLRTLLPSPASLSTLAMTRATMIDSAGEGFGAVAGTAAGQASEQAAKGRVQTEPMDSIPMGLPSRLLMVMDEDFSRSSPG